MELISFYNERLASVMELYAFHSNETEKYWKQDNNAALVIQSKFRMYIRRKDYLKMRTAAVDIQTLYRSYSASKNYNLRQKAELERRDLQFFGEQAVAIQKTFRGYYYRKYGQSKDNSIKTKENIHNYYKRKQQLQALKTRNEEFKKQLDQYGQEQEAEAQQLQLKTAKEQFTSLVKNHHHLSSTKHIPGVYNSPFATNKPRAFNEPIEDHLKQVFTRSYKWRPPSKAQILKHSLKRPQ